MSDRMTPIPFPALMRWILTERQQGAVFGVRRPFVAADKRLDLFDEHLETPFGPAAGPHTQLAQNLVAAYYAGARFFELKTVQPLDGEDLPVAKPCILAEDECYNVEWSTELRAFDAVDEYIKAWFAIKLISRAFGLGAPDGFIFNMSVGYSYEGVTSEKIDACIERLKDARKAPVWQACTGWALENLSDLPGVDAAYIESVSPHVITSITLSTLHGCPPQEIERIAAHLIAVKKLNTFVKCNPTLLGYDFARRTLDALGFDYVSFTDFHFNDDLQYADAVPMFRRLLKMAADSGVSFGLKLSNTFPVEIRRGELPGGEMYMSGRALYPLTVEMARRISCEFDGQLRLSFSGGIDAFNMEALFDAGVWPITLATTLLKPGGYQRLTQMAEALQSKDYAPFTGVSVGKVKHLAACARTDPRGQKPVKPEPKRKIDRKVPLTDCFTAPCSHGCPIAQDIPAYIALAGEGRYEEALRLIVEKNPLPHITGEICAHRCMDKCTRQFCEEAVHIRDTKLLAARQGIDALIANLNKPVPDGKTRAAVVGGGPAGMAAAFFLARQGARVTLFERRDRLGGLPRYVIPGFRITDAAIDADARLLMHMGVDVRTGQAAPDVQTLLAQGYTHAVLAVGAWAPGTLRLERGEADNALCFLAACKRGEAGEPGSDVIVIGGGNTAMDAARAAKRVKGVERVRLVYRRTRRYMPADEEELQLALDDGVEFAELLSPVSFENGLLTCTRMALGAPDASGRRSSVETGETVSLACTKLIAAVGERIDMAFFAQNGIDVTDRGRVKADPVTLETGVPNVYVIGDANRGPSTVVEAIADARKAADAIMGPYQAAKPAPGPADACYRKQGVLRMYDCAHKEAGRCLDCPSVCECCVQVCPNRANVALRVPELAMPQILHIDRLCNACGNCLVFCPYDSAPYLDKLTLFSDEAAFGESTNPGILLLGGRSFRLRLEGDVFEGEPGDARVPSAVSHMLDALLDNYAYLI